METVGCAVGLKDPKQIDDIVAYLKPFDSIGKEGGDCLCRKKAREGSVAAQSAKPELAFASSGVAAE